MSYNRAFKYASYVASLLHKILGMRFTVTGLDNLNALQGQPTMFVANHFTRFETVTLPYLINKYSNRQVRSLADHSLFKGAMGDFLHNLGVVSTKDKNRDKIIISDLVKNDCNWLIYPEGSMIKSKKITKKRNYVSHAMNYVGPIYTGAAVLALKSQLYRRDLIAAHKNGDEFLIESAKRLAHVDYGENLEALETKIMPLSVTYYPIRPGENRLENLAKKYIKKISPRLIEELQIEGNLLANSQINLHFGKAVDLQKHIRVKRAVMYNIPIIKNETKANLVIKYFRNSLTNVLMDKVYGNIKINLDHIFSAVLRNFEGDEIELSHLKRIVYLSALMIVKTQKYIVNQSIEEKNLCNIFIDEKHYEFDGVVELAKNLGEITDLGNGVLRINKKVIFDDLDFAKIRLEKTLQVIFNEFCLLETPLNIVRRNCKIDDKILRQKVVQNLAEIDREIYKKDYKKYFDKDFSKEFEVGLPRFFKPVDDGKKVGVLLCHGYKSSPKEVELLAKFLQKMGFYVYCVRLKGHGTSPINIKDVTWQEWYNCVQRGYGILNNICDEMMMIGFSTGGLLALLSDSFKTREMKAVIVINAALKLQDVRSKFVPAINVWNKILRKFKVGKGLFEYIDSVPENPEFNYSRNYLKGVLALSNLMEECQENLNKVKSPTFVIQAKKDPVINPISGKIIFDKISSKKKKIYEPDFSNHVIINGDNAAEVFGEIEKFIAEISVL